MYSSRMLISRRMLGSELVWRYALKYLGACVVMTVYEMLCPHRGILIDGTLPGEAGEFL